MARYGETWYTRPLLYLHERDWMESKWVPLVFGGTKTPGVVQLTWLGVANGLLQYTGRRIVIWIDTEGPTEGVIRRVAFVKWPLKES